MPQSKGPFVPLNVAVLTVSDTRTRENDSSGDTIEQHLREAGHHVAERTICRDDIASLRAQFEKWLARETVDVIVATGGTGLTRRDVTPEALQPFVTKPIPGFGELFRMLSFHEIGTSTLQSRAQAAITGDKIVFLLPGSTGACRLGMEKIILPQLDARHIPCNLAELLPRIRRE